MKIEFEWEKYEEEDCRWEALFVRVNDGRWMLAMPNFNTENTEEIRQIILNDKKSYTGN